MPAVKKLKIDGIENNNENTTPETTHEDSDEHIHARTFCTYHLRPKKGLDR